MAGRTQEAKQQEGMVSVATEFPTEGLPLPQAVNFTRIDHVGSEVQLSVGYVDLSVLAGIINQAKQGALRETSLKVDVSHRLVLSADAFLRFKTQVDQIAASLAANQPADGTAGKR
jgi:hypothetical protein